MINTIHNPIQSFDPAAMDGDLLFYATKEGYKPLTPDIYKQIQDSKLKF